MKATFGTAFNLAALAAALPNEFVKKATFSGVATFNDYSSQTNTVCGPFSGAGGTYGAAAGDISPDISGGKCAGSINPSICDGQQPPPGYEGPSCPKGNCGTCYRVTNQGGFAGAQIGGVGNSVVVQIIDSCPAESAANFCKTDVPPAERCGSASTNALDIDESAYQVLTGMPFGSGPNLQISISPVSCPNNGSSDAVVTKKSLKDASTIRYPEKREAQPAPLAEYPGLDGWSDKDFTDPLDGNVKRAPTETKKRPARLVPRESVATTAIAGPGQTVCACEPKPCSCTFHGFGGGFPFGGFPNGFSEEAAKSGSS